MGLLMALYCRIIPKGERQGSRKFLSTFIILSFFISNLILTTGCTPGRDVQLDSVASKYVVKLIEELKPSTIEYDNIIQDGAISGEIKDTKGKNK